jgi:hypothetical protein
MRFNLTSLGSLPNVRIDRARRWTEAFCFAVFTLVVIAAPIYYYLAHHGFAGWMPAQTVALVLLAFLSVMGALFFAGAAPPPTSVTVDSEGLAFELKGRQTWRLTWTDPALALRVFRTEGSTRRSTPGPPMIIAIGPLSTRNYLTREAYDEIVAQATAHGLSLAEMPGSRPGWTRTIISHE